MRKHIKRNMQVLKHRSSTGVEDRTFGLTLSQGRKEITELEAIPGEVTQLKDGLMGPLAVIGVIRFHVKH